MKTILAVLGGFSLGAGLVTFLERGGVRALLHPHLALAAQSLGEAVEATSRDVANRARGAAASLERRIASDAVDDVVLVERVRSKLGRLVSHPSAIEASATAGVVTLRGPVLAQEADDLLLGIASVPGVSDVISQLDVHDEPGDVPGLQGGRRRPRRLERQVWTSTLLAGGFGGALVAIGLLRRGVLGTVAGLLGVVVFARSAQPGLRRRISGAAYSPARQSAP